MVCRDRVLNRCRLNLEATGEYPSLQVYVYIERV